MTDELVLAEARASGSRRLFAAFLLGAVGLGLAWSGLQLTLASVSGALMMAAGVIFVWLALRLVLAADQAVVLTAAGLADADGTVIVDLDAIEGVDSSLLSARPSNGFIIRTRTRQAPGWRPGLWWRLGHRVGIGGILPKARTRDMVNRLSLMLAERDQPSDHAT